MIETSSEALHAIWGITVYSENSIMQVLGQGLNDRRCFWPIAWNIPDSDEIWRQVSWLPIPY